MTAGRLVEFMVGSGSQSLYPTGLWGMITLSLGPEGHAEGRRRVCHAGDGQAGAGDSINTRDFRSSGLRP